MMKVLISKEQISARVDELAKDISTKLDDDAIVVGLLQGSFIFMADIMRGLAEYGKTPQTDFIWLSSYGDGQESGRVHIRADLQRSITGRQVLIVDDVYDTGKTIAFAKDYLKAKGAKEVITCLIARKPASKDLEAPDFYGFDLPDYFIVGYGLDNHGSGRGIPDICYIE